MSVVLLHVLFSTLATKVSFLSSIASGSTFCLCDLLDQLCTAAARSLEK